MNHEELFEICESLGARIIQWIKMFGSSLTNTAEICVTKDKFGALFFNGSHFYYNSGFKVTVKDTVGAADSLLATNADKLFSAKK